jgi:hypothetical protein
VAVLADQVQDLIRRNVVQVERHCGKVFLIVNERETGASFSQTASSQRTVFFERGIGRKNRAQRPVLKTKLCSGTCKARPKLARLGKL